MISRLTLLLFALFVGVFSHAQIKINLHNSFGINLVNLEDATGTPEFDDSLSPNTRQLVDWGRFYYNGEVQAFYGLNENIDIGVGIGFNRLYYWEERFRNFFDTAFQFDYGTITTFEVSGIANFNFGDWLLQGSLGLHSFNVGTSTVGTAIGGGKKFAINEKLSVPVLLKADFVFGDGTTIAPNLGFGFMMEL